MVVENQKSFFDNLTKMETENDNQMVGVINDELKKLADQMKIETTCLDRKINKVRSEIDIDALAKKVEKKIGREEMK